MIDIELMRTTAASYNICLTDLQLSKLERYAELLVEWNNKINLTALCSPEDIVYKHFLDSMLVAKHIKEGSKVIDIGSGAGFPGIVLKVIRNDIDLTLLDSIKKRTDFMQLVCEHLDLSVSIINDRAEIVSKKDVLREQYDIATARAVAELRQLAEYCIPFVKVNGLFLAMKGKQADSEIHDAMNAIETLGCEVNSIDCYTLPDNSSRSVVIVRKKQPTDEKYPRTAKRINTNPL